MRSLLPEPDDAVDLARVYAYPEGVPWLRANMVASLDGAIAVNGSSRPLSSSGDRRLLGLLRTLSDVLLVGAGTARAEGYTAITGPESRRRRRAELGMAEVPVVAVVTASCDLDPASRLFAGAVRRTVVITSEVAADGPGRPLREVADVIATPGTTVDLATALGALRERGHRRVLCEGGPGLLADLVAAGLLDELCLTVAPRLTGGRVRGLLDGPSLPDPVTCKLASVLEEDGNLFLRWLLSDR